MDDTGLMIEQKIEEMGIDNSAEGLLSVFEDVIKETYNSWRLCLEDCIQKKEQLKTINAEAEQIWCKGNNEMTGVETTVRGRHYDALQIINYKLADVVQVQDRLTSSVYAHEPLVDEKKRTLKQLEEFYIEEREQEEKLITREKEEEIQKIQNTMEKKRKECIDRMNKAVHRIPQSTEESLKDTLEQTLAICEMDKNRELTNIWEKGCELLETEELVQYCQMEWDYWNEMLQEKVFQAKQKLPDKLPLGQIGIDLKTSLQNDELYQKLYSNLTTYRKMGMLDNNGSCYVPYSVERKENIGVYISADIANYKEEIFALAFQQYTYYPVGKMELLSIDTENYRLFTPFMQLIKEGDKRLIGGMEWSEEKDIEKALKNAEKRINGYKSYEDQEKREQRENFQLMLIAGFPYRFSAEALEILNRMLTDGRQYGTGIIVVESMEHREVSPECKKTVDEIRSKLTYIYEREYGKLGIKLGKKQEATYHFRFGFPCSMDSMKQMIEQIAKEIQEYNRAPLNVMEINEEAFTDIWTNSTIDGIEIPIGRSYDRIVSLVLGRKGTADRLDTRHHVLIEGTTGSGKSKLLQTIVTSALHQYDPSELEIYYLDYKYGMQSSIYSEYDLPSFRAIAVNSEREFGLAVLEKVQQENEKREYIIQKANVDTINNYRQLPEAERMPKILLIMDELSEFLSQKDEITDKAMEILRSLLKTGRSQGIHVILASQTINLSADMLDVAVVRIAFSGSHNILNCQEEELGQFFNNGMHAVFNENRGTKADNVGMRNAYIGEEHRKLLSNLEKLTKQDHYAERYNLKTKVLHTQIEQNKNHPFEKMNFSEQKDGKKVFLYIGENFGFEEETEIYLKCAERQNLLVVAEKAEQILQTYYFTILSILHNELGKGIEDRNIWYIDMNDGSDRRYVDAVIQQFPEKIRYVSVDEDEEEEKINIAKEFIRSIYEITKEREKGNQEENPVYLLIYGAEYLDSLERKKVYRNQMNLFGNAAETKMSLLDMLLYVMERGAAFGVHVIAATCDFELMEDNLCNNFEECFNLRVMYESTGGEKKREIAKRLIKDTSERKRRDSIGAYYNKSSRTEKKFQLFRRYDYPNLDWLRQYKMRYEKYRETEGR